MKKTILLLLLLAFTFACTNSDDKNTPHTNPIDQLPPATHVGANKVGCLLDGEVFLPGNEPLSTNCFYQFHNGGYYFVMAFGKMVNSNNIDVGVGTQKLQIQQNTTYDLVELSDNNAYGGHNYGLDSSYTTQIHTGELTITKLTNQIVSGTFWFDVEDQNGVVHQIREGRFDMQYTN